MYVYITDAIAGSNATFLSLFDVDLFLLSFVECLFRLFAICFVCVLLVFLSFSLFRCVQLIRHQENSMNMPYYSIHCMYKIL